MIVNKESLKRIVRAQYNTGAHLPDHKWSGWSQTVLFYTQAGKGMMRWRNAELNISTVVSYATAAVDTMACAVQSPSVEQMAPSLIPNGNLVAEFLRIMLAIERFIRQMQLSLPSGALTNVEGMNVSSKLR